MAKRLVQLIGLKRRLQALAQVDDDPDALRKGVDKLRRTDQRQPPWTIRRRWRIEGLDCAGDDLYVMTKDRGPAHARVLLYLHGGGYLFGPFGTEWTAIGRIATGSDSDYAMFMYPRAPEHDAAETLHAATAAYQALVDRYGAGNVIIVGTSAGGGLAVALMVSLRDAGSPLPSCSILLSPGVDMTLEEDVSSLEHDDVLVSVDHVRSAGRLYAGDLGPDHPIVSPINADLSELPPMHVFVADSEILRPGVESFADRARAAGTEVHLVLGEDAQHTWPIAPTPEGRHALDQVVAIVATCT